jgi:prepilin-type N-terminal cleavage/methylation domain-containing protein
MTKTHERQQAGFSLLEVLVATAILGVGLAALGRQYITAAHGVADSDGRAQAAMAAAQRIEALSTMEADEVPACAASVSCRAANGVDFVADLPPVGGFACTRWVDGPDVFGPSARPRAAGQKFRIDASVVPHPDAARQPDGRLLTVNVCWRGADGRVHELQARRVLVPGV